MMEIVEVLEREVDKRVGRDATFEQRQDAAVAFMAEALAMAEEEDQAGGLEVTHGRQRSQPEGGPEQPCPFGKRA